jgi:riboflavin biosynthesis pyrimidine reductase
MRQLYPASLDDVAPEDAYVDAVRVGRPDRPWVLLNMVSSADGATVVNGVSEKLGGDGDWSIFLFLRSLADAILAGAGTVRAEGYGPPKVREEHQEGRRRRGQPPRPRLCIATRGAGFDWSTPLFNDPDNRPIILCPADAPADKLDEARRHADVIAHGQGQLDLAAALARLAEEGVGVLLCEGGPALNGTLLEQGLVDELCLTVSPTLVGNGGGATIVGDAQLPAPLGMQLVSVLEQDGELYLRYLLGRS